MQRITDGNVKVLEFGFEKNCSDLFLLMSNELSRMYAGICGPEKLFRLRLE